MVSEQQDTVKQRKKPEDGSPEEISENSAVEEKIEDKSETVVPVKDFKYYFYRFRYYHYRIAEALDLYIAAACLWIIRILFFLMGYETGSQSAAEIYADL